MSGVVACLVCAAPLDALLTGGLQAGVAVLAVVILAVLGAVAVGARRVWREDARQAAAAIASEDRP